MARKLRSGGSTSDNSLDRTKKYKYNTAGTLTEFSGEPGNDDIVFSGSKSNLRRMADLERNISILANKVLTTDGASTDSDDANFGNKFTDDVRFKAETRFDDTMTIKSTVDASAGTVKLNTWQVGGVAVSSSAADLNILDGVTASTADLNILDGVTASTAELNYVSGVTSAIQTQMDTKAPTSSPTFTGTTTIPTADINGGAIDGTTIGANTAAAATVTTLTASSDVTVQGNFTVSGTTTTVNSNDVNIADSTLTLNSDETGTPSQDAGIVIERGTSSNVSFLWDEANDRWTTAGQSIRAGHLLPETDNTYDLGATGNVWRDLYLSGSTIKLGGATLSASGANLSMGSGSFDLSNSTTANLAEHTDYKYYTDTRVRNHIQGADLAMGANNITTTGKMLYSNVYSAEGDLPSASTYHGMFAHVHGTGLAYYAHGGNWVKLAKHDDSIKSNANDTASGVITFSNTTNATSATTGAVIVTGGVGVGGNIYASGDVTAYSDESLKTNIQTIDNGLDKVMALRGITFDRIADGSTSTGVSAQDVAAVLPEAVATDDEGLMAVKYGNLVGLLIEAIKDLKEEVNDLKTSGTMH